MDGYSVKEAATVLGVPKRRVWELIARGVLSGAPEGDGGMRVFLQPRPGKPSPLSADRDEPRRTNGNGGHVESGEGSPFREILTEFRSLTERYGQALLALGEARGEVAALRSRVELLEARLDLRLPGPRTSSTVAWEMPEYSPPPPPTPEVPDASEFAEAPVADPAKAPVAETSVEDAPMAAAEAEATAEATAPTLSDERRSSVSAPEEAPADRGSLRRRRVLRSHSAIAGIAEALQRAQDPTLADLPGAREAAEALAALQREVEARTETIEPEAAIDEAPISPEAQAAIPAEREPEPEPEHEPSVAVQEAAFVEPAAATSAQDLVDEEPPVEEPTPAVVAEDAAETEPESDARAGVGETEPDAARPEAPASSPYTTEIVEPDWFADGDFTWLETAQADSVAAGELSSQAAAEAETPLAADAAPAVDALQDAFEPTETDAETDASEPELAVDAEPFEPEPAAVAEPPQAEPEPEQVREPVQELEDEATEAEAAPAADAIQDAFEPMETDAAAKPSEPEPAVAEALPQAGPQPERFVREPVQELEHEATEAEAAPGADAIRDAFDDVHATAGARAPEVEPLVEPDVPAPEVAAVAAGPAAEAIQDAFEPPEPVEPPPSAGATPTATATPQEEPFSPADVAVFTVDQTVEQSQAEPAPMPDADAQPPPPDARAELTTRDLPPAPPRTQGLGGLAVQAAALPAVQPITPATSRPDEEELMWLGDEFEAAGLEIAAPGWHSEPQASGEARPIVEAQPTPEPLPTPEAQPAPESSVQPSIEPSGPDAHAVPHEAPAHGMSDADLEQIAQDEGWDADEVDAIRMLLGRPTAAQVPDDPAEAPAAQQSTAFSVESPLPPDDVHPMDEGRAEQREPEAHFEPEPMSPVEWPMADPIREAAAEPTAPEPIADLTTAAPQEAEAPAAAAAAEPTRAVPIEESIRRSIAARPADRPSATTDPAWLRRRRGPAARAYRRLRRLLPG